MALGLRIIAYNNANFTSKADAFWFTSEAATISHERSPIASVLPGTEPILIDLGQWRVSIKFEGTAHKDYMLLREQDGDRICRRNDLEILGSNITYSIGKTGGDYVYNYSNSNVNWYNKYLIFEDYSSDNGNNGTNPYKYAVLSGGVTIRTEGNIDFIHYSVQLVGYRII